MQCCFQHFLRSLSTKVTKTYDIDITLILMQLHLILSSVVGILMEDCINIKSILFFSHLRVAGRDFFLKRVLHLSSNLRQSIRPSTINMKVSFSAAVIAVSVKHLIASVFCILFEYAVSPVDLDLLFMLQ